MTLEATQPQITSPFTATHGEKAFHPGGISRKKSYPGDTTEDLCFHAEKVIGGGITEGITVFRAT